MKKLLTHEELLDLVTYDPETGSFTRNDPLKAGPNISQRGYFQISLKNTTYLVHRLAWFYVHGVWPENTIDHIDGDRLNNRIANLRDVTASVNNQNRVYASSNNKAGVLGVNFHAPLNKWRARFKLDGKQKHIGYFDTCAAAHAAYLAAKSAAGVPTWRTQ